MITVEHCRSCGADILWARHWRTGNRMPIDAEPHEAGNVHIDEMRGTFEVLGPVRRSEILAQGAELHRSHFATCPAAAIHRRTAG